MKILVVDDDRRIVQTTADILRIKGHEPVIAYSGEEAVEKVRSDVPDCVLMDIRMPGINGVEAMKQMKTIIPLAPVILVSAYTTAELAEDAKRAGAYAVLTKPINFQMVLSFLDLLHKEESVLVIDDDPVFCKTIKEVLSLRGYLVETETEPQKAMDDLAKDYKLVVVLDLKLGSVNGVEVLRQIRAKYPTKPVVLATGYRDEMSDSIRKGLQIGAYACLYKPFEMDSLFSMIEEIHLKKLQNVLTSA